jgi:hypothetical protein
MALWNNTDREESKPTWLNASQKVRCIRTVAGWELPQDGVSLGGQLMGVPGATSLTFATAYTELLVAMPIDPSVTGVTSSLYANRISATGGLSAANDTPNYIPYFTCPFSGDSATAGGYDGSGLSFANSVTGAGAGYGSYAVNAYGVSTLNFLGGQTAYIKIVANDSNFTQNMTFSEVSDVFGARGNIISGSNLLTTTNVPTGVYETFFGPTSDVNNNIAVFKINKQGATANSGPYAVTLRVTDSASATADTTFHVFFGATAT